MLVIVLSGVVYSYSGLSLDGTSIDGSSGAMRLLPAVCVSEVMFFGMLF